MSQQLKHNHLSSHNALCKTEKKQEDVLFRAEAIVHVHNSKVMAQKKYDWEDPLAMRERLQDELVAEDLKMTEYEERINFAEFQINLLNKSIHDMQDASRKSEKKYEDGILCAPKSSEASHVHSTEDVNVDNDDLSRQEINLKFTFRSETSIEELQMKKKMIVEEKERVKKLLHRVKSNFEMKRNKFTSTYALKRSAKKRFAWLKRQC